MPYLPPGLLHETTFPKAYGKDLFMQLRMIAERYRRFYPQVLYYQIEKSITKVDRDTPVATSQDNANLITGEAGTTAFDTVYREHVPAPLKTTGWTQPHADTASINAAAEEVFKDPISIHVRFFRENKEKEMKLYGFDKVRDVLVTIPTALLDFVGITCQEGDKLVYDGEDYTIGMSNTGGYWKNTNVPLYIALDCAHKRKGA